MASQLPPGTGAFRPEENKNFKEGDHMHGWNIAIQSALDNIGRAPGRYAVDLNLSATIDIKNPGYVVEYIAKFI